MGKLILKMNMSLDAFVKGANGESDWIFETCDEGCTLWELETIWQAGLHVMGRKTFEDMASYWPSATNPFAAPMNAIPKLVFSRSGKIDFDAIVKAADSPSLNDANADDKKKQHDRASPEETKKNQASWRDATVGKDLVAEIAHHKARTEKPLVAYGGASFAQELIKHDLVDEYRLVVHPITLGKGFAIFDQLEKPRPLKLVSSSSFPSGATARIFTRQA